MVHLCVGRAVRQGIQRILPGGGRRTERSRRAATGMAQAPEETNWSMGLRPQPASGLNPALPSWWDGALCSIDSVFGSLLQPCCQPRTSSSTAVLRNPGLQQMQSSRNRYSLTVYGLVGRQLDQGVIAPGAGASIRREPPPRSLASPDAQSANLGLSASGT